MHTKRVLSLWLCWELILLAQGLRGGGEVGIRIIIFKGSWLSSTGKIILCVNVKSGFRHILVKICLATTSIFWRKNKHYLKFPLEACVQTLRLHLCASNLNGKFCQFMNKLFALSAHQYDGREIRLKLRELQTAAVYLWYLRNITQKEL